MGFPSIVMRLTVRSMSEWKKNKKNLRWWVVADQIDSFCPDHSPHVHVVTHVDGAANTIACGPHQLDNERHKHSKRVWRKCLKLCRNYPTALAHNAMRPSCCRVTGRGWWETTCGPSVTYGSNFWIVHIQHRWTLGVAQSSSLLFCFDSQYSSTSI